MHRQPTLLDVARATYETTHFRIQDLRSDNRTVPLVFVRQAFCRVSRRMTERSLSCIGRYIRRHHSTVLHAVNCTRYPGSHEKIERYAQMIEARLMDNMVEEANYRLKASVRHYLQSKPGTKLRLRLTKEACLKATPREF